MSPDALRTQLGRQLRHTLLFYCPLSFLSLLHQPIQMSAYCDVTLGSNQATVGKPQARPRLLASSPPCPFVKLDIWSSNWPGESYSPSASTVCERLARASLTWRSNWSASLLRIVHDTFLVAVSASIFIAFTVRFGVNGFGLIFACPALSIITPTTNTTPPTINADSQTVI